MQLEELEGKYKIVGSNQDNSNSNYQGYLTLILDENKRVIAKWIINGEQLQFGSGFFKDDILVINFNYAGDDDKIHNGIVVYKCTAKNILDGFWSEKHGNPKFLGTEKCIRIV